MPLTIPWTRLSVSWLGIAHYLACVFPQLGSVLYHLFMNHEGGPAVYHTLLTLDMCGVCMVNTLGELTVLSSLVYWDAGSDRTLAQRRHEKLERRSLLLMGTTAHRY